MTIKWVLLYSENQAELRKVGRPVKAFDEETRKLIQDLRDTLVYHADGARLAELRKGHRTCCLRLEKRPNDNLYSP